MKKYLFLSVALVTSSLFATPSVIDASSDEGFSIVEDSQFDYSASSIFLNEDTLKNGGASTFSVAEPGVGGVLGQVNRILVIGPNSAKDVGSSFKTNATISRSQLVTLLNEVKAAEKTLATNKSRQFTFISTIITYPITKNLGYALTAGGATSIMYDLLVDNNLGSSSIQSVLNRSTSTKFTVTVTYTKRTRGAYDKWYEATAFKVTPA